MNTPPKNEANFANVRISQKIRADAIDASARYLSVIS